MRKVLKNTTESSIFVSDTGVSIDQNSSYEIPPQMFWYWVNSEDIVPFIQSEDIVVNDGTNDLDPVNGVSYIRGDIPNIQDDQGVVVSQSVGIRFIGDKFSVSQSQDNPKTADISVNAESAVGGIISLSFSNQGSSTNKWLDYASDTKPSNENPAIIPFDCNLIGLTFTNENTSPSFNIEIWKSIKGQGSSKSKIFTWEIDSKRAGNKTNFDAISLSAGDKVAVFLRDQGANPQNISIILYLVVSVNNSEENTESWSGDF